MIATSLARRIEELAAARIGVVQATVVRAQRPTSAQPGDVALVLADGTIEGFVGGVCAEASVRLQALRALETGEPLLLRVVPGGADGPDARPDEPGALTVRNPCLSGGALEIFLDPCPPAPTLLVVGATPLAQALAQLGRQLGFDVDPVEDAAMLEVSPDDDALVVASHGRDEEPALEAALRAGVPYVGLVASEVRGAAVRDALDVDATLRARLRCPAGLPIGARGPAEIALSIMAEIVAGRRSQPSIAGADETGAGGAVTAVAGTEDAGATPAGGLAVTRTPAAAGRSRTSRAPAAGVPGRGAAGAGTAGRTAAGPRTAIDPVCGMEVLAGDASLHLDADEGRVYFCCEGCRERFAAEHQPDVVG